MTALSLWRCVSSLRIRAWYYSSICSHWTYTFIYKHTKKSQIKQGQRKFQHETMEYNTLMKWWSRFMSKMFHILSFWALVQNLKATRKYQKVENISQTFYPRLKWSHLKRRWNVYEIYSTFSCFCAIFRLWT